MRILRSITFFAFAISLAWPSALEAQDAAELLAQGEALRARGATADAFKVWDKAAAEFAKKRDRDGEYGVVMRQIAACQALGQHKIALTKLRRADELAEGNAHRVAEVNGARGAVSLFAREAGDAEELLRDTLKAARKFKDDSLAMSAQFNLGLLFDGQEKFEDARKALESARDLALKRGNPAFAAQARKALADVALGAGDAATAKVRAEDTAAAAAALPDDHGKAFLLMAAARVLEKVFQDTHENALRLRAFTLHRKAETLATSLGDNTALSYALGWQGSLYEDEKRYDEAIALTQKALGLAQQAQSADALWRWQWQAARIIAKAGQRDVAIDAYRRAVITLQAIRNDIAIRHGNRNARSSFRDEVGGIYFELADLLLQRAAATADDAGQQKLLREARSTAEMLKSAELEDYFQDDCVNLRRELTKNVENLDERAAVIYIIPLADRTEILVSLPAKPGETGRIARFRAEPNDESLTATVRQFRTNLEDRATNAYLEQGQQLYKWLIKPVEALLNERKFDTLVFVPDGAMRTVPMSALHDGERFLVEKYAIAVTPGLELMEAKKAKEVVTRMLVSGLSDAVQGFSALPGVPPELDRVEKLFDVKKANTLRDRAFSSDAVSNKIRNEKYTIVHLATHGQFDRDVRKSFVLTHDKQLTLDDLERLIRPGQLRDEPLDLLALSACQTAAGDDRAALGLAGVAVKAGARSAFATLWFVNDRVSSQLVSDFYTEMKGKAARGKSQALQIAQVKLIKDVNYGHPCYWAPYLIIGNWL